MTRVAYKFESNSFHGGKIEIERLKKELGPISYEEKLVAIVFTLAGLCWISRSFFLQNILPLLDDTTIAISFGLILFILPSKQKATALLSWKDTINLPWGIIILFGGGMALAFVVSSTGLAQWLANLIPTNLNLILLMVLLITLIVFLTELTSNIATTMTFIPIIFAISLNLDINPLILTVPLTFAASCAFMLPVATPPNSIVFASKHVPIREMVRVGFWLNLFAIAVIVLLGYYYIPVIFN